MAESPTDIPQRGPGGTQVVTDAAGNAVGLSSPSGLNLMGFDSYGLGGLEDEMQARIDQGIIDDADRYYGEQQQSRFSAQNRLFGTQPDIARHISVKVDPVKSGLGTSDLGMDSWARQRGFGSTHKFGAASNQFYDMDERRLAATQQALIRGGFLKGDDIAAVGIRDPAGRDHKAWQMALEQAARLDKEVFSMLGELGETGAWDEELAKLGGAGGGGPVRRRPDIQLMSAADAEQLANDIGQELIGRKLNDEERQKIVRKLHSTQRSEQSAAIDVAMSETGGGTSTQPTSAQTVVENALRTDDALNTEVQGAEALGAFDQLTKMLGAGGI